MNITLAMVILLQDRFYCDWQDSHTKQVEIASVQEAPGFQRRLCVLSNRKRSSSLEAAFHFETGVISTGSATVILQALLISVVLKQHCAGR